MRSRLFIVAVIGIPLLLAAVALWVAYQRGAERNARRDAARDAETAAACSPWRDDVAELNACSNAYEVWRRCDARLRDAEDEIGTVSGVVCDHPVFQFRTRGGLP